MIGIIWLCNTQSFLHKDTVDYSNACEADGDLPTIAKGTRVYLMFEKLAWNQRTSLPDCVRSHLCDIVRSYLCWYLAPFVCRFKIVGGSNYATWRLISFKASANITHIIDKCAIHWPLLLYDKWIQNNTSEYNNIKIYLVYLYKYICVYVYIYIYIYHILPLLQYPPPTEYHHISPWLNLLAALAIRRPSVTTMALCSMVKMFMNSVRAPAKHHGELPHRRSLR